MSDLSQNDDINVPILLIENDLVIIDITQRIIAKAFPEFGLVPIATFEEIVSYLSNSERSAPKLILFDVFEPGREDGFTLLQKIKQHPLTQNITSVVYSHSDDQNHVIKAYECGAASYIVKPASLLALRRSIQSLFLYWSMTAAFPRTDRDNEPY